MRRSHIALALVLLCGCSENFISRKRLGLGEAIGTQADLRIVTANPVQTSGGRVIPRQIVCAEPSPDIAKAISEAKSLGSSFVGKGKGAELPAEIDLKTALALSSSHAEAVAQMTNRLATIQLLRDGLYRACEAYQNGAISDTTYAVMLSRFDKAMVTMLLGELAAGNFGQSLAALTTSASGSSEATLDVGPAEDAVKAAQDDVTAKQKARDDAANEVKALPEDASADTRKAKTEALLKADDDLQKANAALAKAKDTLDAHLTANAKTKASGGATAAGAVAHSLAEGAAKRTDALRNMQQKYLENINFDPLVVACLTALDRRSDRFYRDGEWRSDDVNQTTTLITFCDEHLGKLLKGQAEYLDAVVKGMPARPIAAANLHNSVGSVLDAAQDLGRLKPIFSSDDTTAPPGEKPAKRTGQPAPAAAPAAPAAPALGAAP